MKAIMVVLNIITAVMFFTLLYSAANIVIDIPSQKSMSWSVEGTNLTINVPIQIRNGGIYPIENITISVTVDNGTALLFNTTFHMKEIAAMSSIRKIFTVKINLIEFYKKLGLYYVFHGGLFNLTLDIHAFYWILADFNAKYVRAIDWQPLIKHYQIYQDEISFQGDSIVVPYFISKLPIDINATIGAEIRDLRGLIATGEALVIFDKKSYLKLHLLRDVSDMLTTTSVWNIDYFIKVGGIRFGGTYTYRWSAPLENMHLETSLNGTNLTVILAFTNGFSSTLHFLINEKVYLNDETLLSKNVSVTLSSGESAKIPLFSVSEIGDYLVELTVYCENFNAEKTIYYSLEVGQ